MINILNTSQEDLLKKERRLLSEVEASLRVWHVDSEHGRTLIESISQLDELFLLVIVGEFNAGKSAFINALLGSSVLKEGVTPTTSKIHLIRFADELEREHVEEGYESVGVNSEFLRHLNIVDTPGTNALDRSHEALTNDFVPRSDLVLFITSADRPFSESERAFLESIKDWGKKILIVINKIDILPGEEEVDEVFTYVSEHARTLLGISPQVLKMSALKAMQARTSGDHELLTKSGLPDVEANLLEILRSNERIGLKLINPIGVASSILGTVIEGVEAEHELLLDDIHTLDDIERQLVTWSDDVNREFKLRLTEIDNILHTMEKRGITFFDDTLRLSRIPKLFNAEAVKRDFEHDVIGNAPHEIETKVEAIIDWLVQSGLDQWQAVVKHVTTRKERHTERIVGEIGGRFDLDRVGLLDTIGRAARSELESYDRHQEARQLADDVQRAVAGTALVEVGAIGLGATIAFLASGTAADATGLIAAGLIAALGLFILPNKKRQAKKELSEKIMNLKTRLMSALSEQFETAALSSQARVRETIAPYTRFVTSERDRLREKREEIEGLSNRLDALRAEIEGAE